MLSKLHKTSKSWHRTSGTQKGSPFSSKGDYVPNSKSQQRSNPDALSATSKKGLDREAQAALLRVRTGPECPEGNLRELT